MKLSALTTAMLLAASPMAAEPETPLRDVSEIRESLLAVGIAYQITEKCPSISARYFKGLSYLYSIRSRARELGYSEAAIEEYVNSPAEKKALETEGLKRLADQGATSDRPDMHCVVGEREMANGTLIGSFLR